MKIGYIGLGNMGGALAARLQLTHPLTVHDRSASAVQALVDLGATAAQRPQDLAAGCDIVFLCLPTSQFVDQVLFGADGDRGRAAARGAGGGSDHRRPRRHPRHGAAAGMRPGWT